MKRRGFFKITPLVIVFILLITGYTQLSATPLPTDDKETPNNSTTMTAKELYDAFKKDKDEALKQYAGKIITIKGIVVYTGPDVYALPSVELSEKKGGKSRTLCVLPFSDYLKLRKVSKGNEVEIKGEVRGFYEKGDQVLMKQCVILEKSNE